MMKHTKARLILLGVLCAGLLIGGVGVGVSFADFSQFTYAGEWYPDNMPVEEYSTKVRTDSADSAIFLETYQYEMQEAMKTPGVLTIRTDDALAPGVIEAAIRYRGTGVHPEAWCRVDGNDREALNISVWNTDPVAALLTAQKQILSDVKEFKLGTYHPVRIEGVTLTLHPDDIQRLDLSFLGKNPADFGIVSATTEAIEPEVIEE